MTNNRKKPAYQNKYDPKLFGIATGALASILSLLVVINTSISNIDTVKLLKPFIPFWTGISLLNIIGGILVSFIWGWLLGYFFILFYNFFDRRFSSIQS